MFSTSRGGNQILPLSRSAIRQRQVAYHESGHAITGRAMGLPIVKVRLIGWRGLWRGETGFGGTVSTETVGVAEWERRLVVTTAGAAAEAIIDDIDRYGVIQSATNRNGRFGPLLRRMAHVRRFQPEVRSRLIAHVHKEAERRELDLRLVAGVLFLSEKIRPHSASPLRGDCEVAEDLAIRLLLCRGLPCNEASVINRVRCAEQLAETLLSVRWAQVEKLAKSLLRRKHHRMTGRQIERLLKG